MPRITKSFQMELNDKAIEMMNLAIHHDYILFKSNGMDKESFSEWIRFLVNNRITQILHEVEE